MNRRVAGLLAAGLAASGCRTPDDRRDRDRADPPPQTRPAGRSWLDGPGPRLAEVGVPKADSWADARDPGYDLQRDVQGVLAGFVEDPDGRKRPDAFIEVEPVDGAGGGAPVGTQTGKDGYFLIKGLKPDRAYQLTVRAKVDGKEAAGRVYARTGSPASQRVRLPLIEDMQLPAATPVGGSAGVPDDRPPRDEPRASADPRPEPKPHADPPPAPAEPPVRPEMTTQGPPGIARPPLANIRPPGVVPPARESRSPPAGKRVSLLTPAGDTRELPAGGPVLVHFLTTTAPASRDSLAAVGDLQARYGLKGLEVVGVVCDEVGLSARQAVAGRHQRDGGLNHLLYVEPDEKPGALAKRFKVATLPGLVLLDAGGTVLWKGRPADADEVEKAIRDRLRWPASPPAPPLWGSGGRGGPARVKIVRSPGRPTAAAGNRPLP